MCEYVACICEGNAERAVLNLLLDNHKLIFERESLIEECILRCRKAKDFENQYLRKAYPNIIKVYRVQDSRRENFKLSKAYENKVDVKNVITSPEIEMLIICNEGAYKEYEREKRKNPKLKPYVFCKTNLKFNNVKSYEFYINYFSDIQILIKAIQEYKRLSKVRPTELCLCDLLNN